MSPLPNMKVLPDGWQAFHQPTIRGTMRSTVRITRLADQSGTRDPVAGRTTFAVPWVVYEGPARIQARTSGAQQSKTTTVADRPLTIGAYLMGILVASAPVFVGDVLEVLTCPDDLGLVAASAKLQVVDVPHADTAWQKNLGCDLYQPTTRG